MQDLGKLYFLNRLRPLGNRSLLKALTESPGGELRVREGSWGKDDPGEAPSKREGGEPTLEQWAVALTTRFVAEPGAPTPHRRGKGQPAFPFTLPARPPLACTQS